MIVARKSEWIGNRVHRAGWPYVMSRVNVLSNGHGNVLEDFIEQSYSYRLRRTKQYALPYDDQDWVGVMHHPSSIASPLARDKDHEARRIERHKKWQSARARLRGIVCLSEDLERSVNKWLPGIKTVSLKHPTDLNCRLWDYDLFTRRRIAACIGFFLRDTRVLHRIECPAGWELVRGEPHLDWMKRRDQMLKNRMGRSEVRGARVLDVPFMNDEHYDDLLACSVVVTWLYGASANNVLVECIARGTPVVINPLPSVVEYLGREYPLYAREQDHIHALFRDERRIVAAHQYLRGMDRSWLDANVFARRLAEFVDAC